MPYIVYDGENYTHHETEEDAKREAHNAMLAWEHVSYNDGEWPQEVEHVCWAEIRSEVVGVIEDNDEGVLEYDYKLRDLPSPKGMLKLLEVEIGNWKWSLEQGQDPPDVESQKRMLELMLEQIKEVIGE